MGQSLSKPSQDETGKLVVPCGLIAVLCVNISTQETQQKEEDTTSTSEMQDDNPLWSYFYYKNPEQEAMAKRVLPYIVHKRMPYIVHKRMPYIVHKRMPAYLPVHKRSTSEEEEDTPTKRMVPLEEDIGPEEIAKFLGSYQPRALRMIPFIH